MFGVSFMRYAKASQAALQSGDKGRLAAVLASSSETDRDLSKTLATILMGIATTVGINNGYQLYNLCEGGCSLPA